jgi:hypothetical protein
VYSCGEDKASFIVQSTMLQFSRCHDFLLRSGLPVVKSVIVWFCFVATFLVVFNKFLVEVPCFPKKKSVLGSRGSNELTCRRINSFFFSQKRRRAALHYIKKRIKGKSPNITNSHKDRQLEGNK